MVERIGQHLGNSKWIQIGGAGQGTEYTCKQDHKTVHFHSCPKFYSVEEVREDWRGSVSQFSTKYRFSPLPSDKICDKS